MLIAAAIDNMKRANQISNVTLRVLQSNQSAINFYQKHGFSLTNKKSVEVFEKDNIVDIEMLITLNQDLLVS